MRRNSKSKRKGPASFVIGEEAIVDDAFRTEQPSGSNPTEETAEDRQALASPGGGSEPNAASRQRVPREEVPAEAPASSSEAPAWDALDEEEPEPRGFREAPADDNDLPPAPIARSSSRHEPGDEELLYPTREELEAEEHGEEREEDAPEERPSRRSDPRPALAFPSLRRGGSDERDEPAESEAAEGDESPRLEERERRGLAVAGVVVLVIAAIGLSGLLKGGGDEEQSAGPGRGDRLSQLQDRRAERRAERLADRRAERIAERRQERLAVRRQERLEAREAEQAEATPAPAETAPVTVPAPAPAPVAPAPAPTGDNIAGNEWGP